MNGRRSTGRRAAAACVTLLLLWLPALVGGLGIDQPARPGEWRRLEEGAHPTMGPAPRSQPARMYYALTAPAQVSGAGVDAAGVLGRARLANVLALLGIAGLLYLTLLLAGRRLSGLLACVALAALPPVAVDGAVLRPEVPASLFGWLAILMVVGFPQLLRRRGPARWLGIAAACLAIAASIGLAASCASPPAVLLLVPGGALMLLVGSLVLGAPAMVRRRTVWRLPLRAMQARVLPWVVLGLVDLGVVLWVLEQSVAGDPSRLPSTAAAVGVLPAGVGGWLLGALAGLGALGLVVAVGLRLGRQLRVRPDAVLLIAVAVLVIQRWLGGQDDDGLLAAPAVALLIAEGTRIALVFGVARGVRVYRATNIA